MATDDKNDLQRFGIAHPAAERSPLVEGYRTSQGVMYNSTVEDFLDSDVGRDAKGSANLIFTSPPFLLNRKKAYGNHDGEVYVEWLSGLAPKLVDLLTPDGSIVMELGNAWVPGKPTMSLLVMKALIAFAEAGNLHLCQQFVWENSARLPTPAQWVNVKRIRVKDSFTHLWWMSPTPFPKADNRRVLTPYSKSMEKLLRTGKYNSGRRPSGHNISPTGFLTDHGGAIPSNVLRFSNTRGGDAYRKYCKEYMVDPHPAPMPTQLVDFFVNLLTDEGDLVFDPFGGSNTTGAVAEAKDRRWLVTEPDRDYVFGSRGRFADLRDS